MKVKMENKICCVNIEYIYITTEENNGDNVRERCDDIDKNRKNSIRPVPIYDIKLYLKIRILQ
jgi:hypothetical protein